MMRRWIVFAALAAVLPTSSLAYEVPPNDGFVTQTFAAITPEQEQELEQILTAYRQQTSNEIAILLTDTLGGEAIADVGVQVGRAWRVGTAEDDNGILLLAALEDREMTIQVGYGLEGAVPDLVAKGIIDEDIIPAFTEGQYAEGLLAAVDSLQKHIGGEYTADRYTDREGSLGQFGFLFVFILLNFLGALLGRSKSWWLGGVLGGFFGIILTALFRWWIAIPVLTMLGLLFDFIVSRAPRGGRHGRGGYWGGGGFGSGRGGGGGFGGFGGGSFGGGGASGKW